MLPDIPRDIPIIYTNQKNKSLASNALLAKLNRTCYVEIQQSYIIGDRRFNSCGSCKRDSICNKKERNRTKNL